MKTIIDLRDKWEVEKHPNVFSQATSLTYRHLPLIGNAFADRRVNESPHTEMHEIYAQYVTHCQPQIGAILGAIAESDGCTLFHWHAGKDRTGIIAALVLGRWASRTSLSRRIMR